MSEQPKRSKERLEAIFRKKYRIRSFYGEEAAWNFVRFNRAYVWIYNSYKTYPSYARLLDPEYEMQIPDEAEMRFFLYKGKKSQDMTVEKFLQDKGGALSKVELTSNLENKLKKFRLKYIFSPYLTYKQIRERYPKIKTIFYSPVIIDPYSIRGKNHQNLKKTEIGYVFSLERNLDEQVQQALISLKNIQRARRTIKKKRKGRLDTGQFQTFFRLLEARAYGYSPKEIGEAWLESMKLEKSAKAENMAFNGTIKDASAVNAKLKIALKYSLRGGDGKLDLVLMSSKPTKAKQLESKTQQQL